MDETEYKKFNKFPSCNVAPFSFLIPSKIRKETLLKIKNESIDLYGEDLSGECPKRKVCAISKECLGRPLPFNSPTAKPYLDQLAKTQKIIGEKLFVTTCTDCSIAKSCSKSCPTVNDFLKRGTSPSPKLYYSPNTNELKAEIENYDESIPKALLQINNIPWEILTEKQTNIIKSYIYDQRDFLTVANKFNLTNQAEAKYVFYSALNKLSEYGILRQFIDNNEDKLTKVQLEVLKFIYFDNNSFTETAAFFGLTKQGVSNIITRVIEKFNIKFTKFVSKKEGKVIYNILEFLK